MAKDGAGGGRTWLRMPATVRDQWQSQAAAAGGFLLILVSVCLGVLCTCISFLGLVVECDISVSRSALFTSIMVFPAWMPGSRHRQGFTSS